MNATKLRLFCASIALMLGALGAPAAEAPATFKVSEFNFARPSGWEWVESSSAMRKAQLRVPDPNKKEPGEVVFYHFGPSNGGGTKANITRWFHQFREPEDQIKSKVEEAKVGDTKVTYVQAEGTYLSGMPGGPQTPMSNYALMGAILESAQGNVFVKLTGPAPLVKSSAGDFKKLVESAKK